MRFTIRKQLVFSVFIVISIIASNAEICRNDAGDEFYGGACHITSHTFAHPIDSNNTAWRDDGEIKEYHFHTYWFQHRPESYAAALRIQTELINAVAEGKFVVVLPGITEDILPRINEEEIPYINTKKKCSYINL